MQYDPVISSIYDRLWHEAEPSLKGGSVETDPWLDDREHDRRRGITVIVRPSPEIIARCADVLEELERMIPGQYRYTAAAMHVTVLSLFTATADHQPFFARLPEYLEQTRKALDGMPQFDLHFQGLTASRNSIMAQGFPSGPALERIRNSIRTVLRAKNLDGGMDVRYRIQTAHSTLLRFRTVPSALDLLAAFINASRSLPLGSMRVSSLQLVRNDWYMSEANSAVLETYPLA